MTKTHDNNSTWRTYTVVVPPGVPFLHVREALLAYKHELAAKDMPAIRQLMNGDTDEEIGGKNKVDALKVHLNTGRKPKAAAEIARYLYGIAVFLEKEGSSEEKS